MPDRSAEDVLREFFRLEGYARDSARVMARDVLSVLRSAGYPVEAGPELAACLEQAIDELQEATIVERGEDYNNPRFNAALTSAKGETDG